MKITKKSKSSYELLAPAGSFASLAAAVNAGADAVYFGLKEAPNMRATAKNFSIEDLPEVRKICSRKKVKMYLTLNTIIYDAEIERISKIIKQAGKYIDAVICWDLGVIEICRKNKIPFHVSTQASVANANSAKFYKKLGAERVILARELNLEQIKEISKIIDVEVFVHGAMCVSVSGRCFTSQFLFGKSANRGECLQPCRRAYIVKDEEGNELKLENNTVMSAKDLCLLPFIEKLKEAGVKAFKIEGRNREPEYVDMVVSVYRKALDKNLSESEIRLGIKELSRVYNKGFSSGFLFGAPSSKAFSKAQNSSSTQKKLFVGKVLHYYPRAGVAAIKLNTGKLQIGDTILIIGDKTGIVRARIERIEINSKPLKEAVKGQEVGIKTPLVRKNDSVYLVVGK